MNEHATVKAVKIENHNDLRNTNQGGGGMNEHATVKAVKIENHNDLRNTLVERGKRYGPFAGHANITQALKQTMHDTKGWDRLNPSQRESLEMIVHKIGRILNGDPNYDDSWFDIAGYAKLVEDEINGVIR